MIIGVFTDTRAEYSLLKPIMREIIKSKNLELKTIVTGMHLLTEFGETINLIKDDGFDIDYIIDVPKYTDTKRFMTKLSGLITSELGCILDSNEIDLLLVLGDRFEVLAASFAATLSYIPVAHISGGDISGNIDDSIRHAITKLSHLHFCSTKKSAQRVKKLGEEKWRIHVVGSPSVDNIQEIANTISEKFIKTKYKIPPGEPYIVVTLHPETGLGKEQLVIKQLQSVIQAITSLDMTTVFIYPNYEPGSKHIIEELNKLSLKPKIKIYKNIPVDEYLALCKFCSVMIGNSSSGIVESAILRVPSITLGSRQQYRERDSNVINCSFDADCIVKYVKKIIQDKKFYKKLTNVKGVYGCGSPARKIVEILENTTIDMKLVNKRLTF